MNLPSATYGVAVSGGADSVALLRLCLERRQYLNLHVLHVDHETRAGKSAEDARFVMALAEKFGLPCEIGLRSEIEPLLPERPANRSALYRAVRHAFFRRVCAQYKLAGVLLAHHADDQAETVLQRMLRGSGPAGLVGMSPRTDLDGLILQRPLLETRREELRAYLHSIGQDWREDSSNNLDDQSRNRLRKLLAATPELVPPLLSLGHCCRALRDWAQHEAPTLPEQFPVSDLRGKPLLVAMESARRWLIARGAPPGDLDAAVLERLVEQARDAASSPRQHYPGGVWVCRRQNRILADRA